MSEDELVVLRKTTRSTRHRIRLTTVQRVVYGGEDPDSIAAGPYQPTARSIRRWVEDYRRAGAAALEDRPKSGRSVSIEFSQIDEIAAIVRDPDLSVQTIASRVGASRTTVARALYSFALSWRLENWMSRELSRLATRVDSLVFVYIGPDVWAWGISARPDPPNLARSGRRDESRTLRDWRDMALVLKLWDRGYIGPDPGPLPPWPNGSSLPDRPFVVSCRPKAKEPQADDGADDSATHRRVTPLAWQAFGLRLLRTLRRRHDEEAASFDRALSEYFKPPKPVPLPPFHWSAGESK